MPLLARQQAWTDWRATRAHQLLRHSVASAVLLCGGRVAAQQTYTVIPAQAASAAQLRSTQPAGKQPGKKAPSVTLIVKDSSLSYVLHTLAQQAHRAVVFNNTDPLFAKHVNVHIIKAQLTDAIATVLKGTGLTMTTAPDGETLVIHARNGGPAADSVRASGVITGHIVDSSSDKGIQGAVVAIEGTKVSTLTSKDGAFTLRDVPVGKQFLTVKLFGYRPASRTLMVTQGARAQVNLMLVPTATVLSGVVTTATGTQRRVEMGNDITTINVDSVMKVAPITSVTDLLETRVPGLTVLHSSGIPGDPSRIRLRGASSITGNNDPIVIVDGARVYAAQSDARNSSLAGARIGGTNGSNNDNTGWYATPSPLDQIDPNTIATIEVFKGPSATALYGSDAANGVIVITTKHGQANQTHWNVSLGQGVNWVPGAWPVNYYRFGSNTITALIPGESALGTGMCLWSDTQCHVDSIVGFQALNDPRYTVFSHGSTQNTSITVSGGVPSLLYSFTGSAQRTTGNLKLPGLEQQRYEKFYGPIPNDLVHPDRYTTIGGSGNITAQPTAALSIQWNSSLLQGDQRRSSLETAISQLQQAYIDPTQLASGSLIKNAYERATDHQISATNSVRLQWQARSWFLLNGTGGLNTIQRTDETYIPYGVNSASSSSYSQDTTGSYGLGKGTSQMMTATLGATFPARFVNTAVGLNYTESSIADVSAYTSQLSPGVSRPQSFPTTAVPGNVAPSSFRQSTSAASTYGWYVQPTLHLNSRFFVNPGFRLDGGSASGSHAGLTGFPKLDFSYVAVDQDNPVGILTLFRPRLAFGYAGTQPSPVDKLRLFNSVVSQNTLVSLDGGVTQVPIVQLTSLGNTNLRPERTSEIEGGFDADLGDDRMQFTLTFYNKTRHDAIISIPVAPSVSGAQATTIQKNIGVVRNTGTEVSLTARLLDTRMVNWMVTTNVSQDKNKVVRLNPGESTIIFVGNTRVEAGYPLWGSWARPILSYFDANHNGVIEGNEIRLGDSATFIGQSDPKYQLNASSTLALLNGQLSVTANVSYQSGLTQTQGNIGSDNTMILNLPNVPGATFATQAAVVASAIGTDGSFNFNTGSQSEIGLIQTVNMFRFNSLSINYRPPARVARWFHSPNMSVALQGSNLGLHTNYRGIDPNVNAFSTASRGDILRDTGELPQQRTWTLSVRLGN